MGFWFWFFIYLAIGLGALVIYAFVGLQLLQKLKGRGYGRITRCCT
jgi:hypothetical protein